MIIIRRSSNKQTNRKKRDTENKMTITESLEEFELQYHSSYRPPLPSTRETDRLWCGKHIRFSENPESDEGGRDLADITERQGGIRPHGLPTNGGKWPQGTFWLYANSSVIKCVGGDRSLKEKQQNRGLGKTLEELNCNYVFMGWCGSNKRYQCCCSPV